MVLLCHALFIYAIEPNNDAKRVQTESDAHIIGDVTDKTTGDHLGFITIAIRCHWALFPQKPTRREIYPYCQLCRI